MIQIMFEFLGDVELVIVDKNQVFFGNTSYGAKLATIDGLKLNYGGGNQRISRFRNGKGMEKDCYRKIKEKN